MELVLVECEYEYTARDGSLVYITPNERYILLAKTNSHWWHVRKDQQTKPFYIPAKYVRELPPPAQSPLDPKSRSLTSPDPVTDRGPVNTLYTRSDSVTKARAFTDHAHRMSTFGYFGDFTNIKTTDHTQSVLGRQVPTLSRNVHRLNRHSLIPGFTFTSGTPDASYSQHNYPQPHILPKTSSGLLQMDSLNQPRMKDQVEPQSSEGQMKILCDPSRQSFPSHDSDIYEADIQTPELMEHPPPVLSRSLASTETASSQLLSLAQEICPDVSLKYQVENESDEDSVYANVAHLRRSLSESPPPASPCSPSLDPEGWEVHTDQESGQQYYYHPPTGRTTWDNPLYPPIDPDVTVDESCSPSPSPSPTAASPPAWTPGWEQLLDETSGRLYFYNPASGETSWEPPEPQSLSTQMEPLGGLAPPEDVAPPLPEEDYPAPPTQLTRVQEESLAVAPVTFSKEYAFSQISRPVIPRASLDRNPPPSWTSLDRNPPPSWTSLDRNPPPGWTSLDRNPPPGWTSLDRNPPPGWTSLDRNPPPGWNLFVDSDGTWVFTSEHSHEQWIKSLDDQGQTYYYLKDGTRSQWNLPEAPVALGQSKMGNGTDAVSVTMNWRHTMNPAQLSARQDHRKFYPAHRRNASDYGSESSSPGDSPETHADGLRHGRNPDCLTSEFLLYTVQNLEKAGILNKTKVSENGKRVRKNWAQSWTVLLGGVLTFHKDPKSASTGASNKTNQIVPEVAVNLRGAMIGWAPKDKSSKKNVLELKSRNGIEFLIQYDTESIINDWHKVLVDTIQQLEQQDQQSEDEDGDVSETSSSTDRDLQTDRSPGSQDKRKLSSTSVLSSSGETDQKKVRTKLIKFLLKRPTLQSVKEKGYIRDNVFGSHLATLCAQERTTIPSFVEKCIKAVERRGLDIDGIYRVSGNLAVIQKLRFKADHEELDLEDGQWEDVHVITGALKLFFRELPEPLFPYSHFNSFMAAIRVADYNLKVSYMRELVKSLPPANHDTMELLFGHLHKVIEFGEENRMSVQNVAIVFGPTLLRPEMESANLTMHMVFQNQIVELILNQYQHIFYSS